MQLKIKAIAMAILISGLWSCSNKEEKIETLDLNKLELTAEGPIFEGSNTLQSELNNVLNEFLKTKNLEFSKISSANLSKCRFYTDDSSNFDYYGSITLQGVADKIDMFTLATANNKTDGVNELTASVATEQDKLLDLLNQDKCTLVADANIKKDMDGNLKIYADLSIEIKY